jgi:NAD(P)-dependent dehydrogenase (short-subunit alcohol dehydrogenase family)
MRNRHLYTALLLILTLPFTSVGSRAEAPAGSYTDFLESAQSQIVVVTGSNRGIGLGWVEHYLAEDSSVIATCRKPSEAQELVALFEKYGNRLLIEQLDVTDEESINRLGSKLERHEVAIDIAISNAGVTVTEPFGSWTRRGFEANISVNTIGAALFAQMVVPHLNDGATLVQITSAVGSISRARRDNPLDAYAVSKAGLNMLTRRLAVKLKDRNILVVSVTPGRVLTDMNPNGIISVEESVALMTRSLQDLTIEDSGTFINNEGKVMAW